MKSEFITLGKRNVSVAGRFRLDVNRDKKKFALTNISAFVPYGKSIQERIAFKTESGEVNSIIISKVSIPLKPDENELDRHNVSVFIQHPEVRIAGMTEEEHRELVRLKIKKANPKFTITNVDKVETTAFDDEVEIINARGMLYTEEAGKALSKERLVWLCANFNLPYRNTSMTDKKRYKIFLTKKLDAFIQSSNENRKAFVESLDNVKKTEMVFYINELKAIEVITDIGGIYKVGDRPVGATIDHIINWYEQNSEIYAGHQEIINNNIAGTNLA